MIKTILLLLLTLPFNTLLHAQNCYVFIGSYNRDKTSDGIYVFQLDTVSGELAKISSVNHVFNPSYLTLSSNGQYVYACTDTKTPNAGSVSSFAFNALTGKLTPLNKQKSGGENPVYLTIHPNGKWLINGNYTEGGVSVYPLAQDGTIDSMAQLMPFTEGSVDKGRQDRAHIHSTVFSPDARFVYFPDLGADKIRCYEFDSTQDQPLKAILSNNISTDPGSGPRHFTFHPNGKYAYCIEELSGTISTYAYTNGKLDSIERIAAHTSAYTDGFNSADIHISPDGRFLYASNRGEENNIAIFSIEDNGLLKTIGYQYTYGNHPRIFAMDPSGKFIVVANQISGDVVVFKRDFQTGLMTKTGSTIPIRNPSCVQIRYYNKY